MTRNTYKPLPTWLYCPVTETERGPGGLCVLRLLSRCLGLVRTHHLHVARDFSRPISHCKTGLLLLETACDNGAGDANGQHVRAAPSVATAHVETRLQCCGCCCSKRRSTQVTLCYDVMNAFHELRRMHLVDYSEYPAQCDERRAFISGFTGSAGTPRIVLGSCWFLHAHASCAGCSRMRRDNPQRRILVYRRTLLPTG